MCEHVSFFDVRNTEDKQSHEKKTKQTDPKFAKMLEHNSMSASGPQMQLGTPPRAGRKMAAMVLIHLNPDNHLLLLLLHSQLTEIIGND